MKEKLTEENKRLFHTGSYGGAIFKCLLTFYFSIKSILHSVTQSADFLIFSHKFWEILRFLDISSAIG